MQDRVKRILNGLIKDMADKGEFGFEPKEEKCDCPKCRLEAAGFTTAATLDALAELNVNLIAMKETVKGIIAHRPPIRSLKELLTSLEDAEEATKLVGSAIVTELSPDEAVELFANRLSDLAGHAPVETLADAIKAGASVTETSIPRDFTDEEWVKVGEVLGVKLVSHGPGIAGFTGEGTPPKPEQVQAAINLVLASRQKH